MKDSESRFVQFPNDPEFLTAIGYFVPAPGTTMIPTYPLISPQRSFHHINHHQHF